MIIKSDEASIECSRYLHCKDDSNVVAPEPPVGLPRQELVVGYGRGNGSRITTYFPTGSPSLAEMQTMAGKLRFELLAPSHPELSQAWSAGATAMLKKYVEMLAAHKAVSPAGESPVVGSELIR